MQGLILKMSIITTIQTMSDAYTFAQLDALTYNQLESIRDRELKDYNARVKGV